MLQLAFGTLTESEPVVLTMEDEVGLPLEHDWPSHVAASAAEFSDIANGLLQAGPVLLIPAWGRVSGTQAKAAGIRSRHLHEIAIAGVRPSGPEALVAALLPASALTALSGQKFRGLMAQHWQPCLVVFARDVPVGAHVLFDTAVVFWRARSAAPQPLILFRLPPEEDEETVESDLRRLLGRRSGKGRFGYALTDHPRAGESLAMEMHDPATAARWADLTVWGATVPLSYLFEFPGPALHKVAHRHRFRDQQEEGTVRVVSGRDLRQDGTVAGPDDSSQWAEVPPEEQLRTGDILLRRIAPKRAMGSLVVAEVTADDLPLAANDTVVTLRPVPHLPRPQRLFAVQFLRSPLAAERVGGISGLQVSVAALRDMPVPTPDAPLAATLEGLQAAISRLETWRSEADALLRSVFDDESAGTARRRILESGRRLRMRVDAAALLDDFGHQVRTRFPHPIAYRWSELQVERSKGVHEGAYASILETAEVLLCYAALTVLALSRDTGLQLGAVDSIRRRLSRGGTNGPGFGDWVAVLQEVAESNAFRDVPEGDQLADFRRAFSHPDVTSARRRLARRRNARAHLRRVDPSDLPAAIEEALEDLRTLLEQASFLADLTLIHVTHVGWDNLRGISEVGHQELMGDNALVPGQQRSHNSSDLEIGSLYLVNEDGRLHLLRPFMLWRRCPLCRSWETFHLDHAPDATTVAIKSLERGHVDKDPTLRHALEHVGLLD